MQAAAAGRRPSPIDETTAPSHLVVAAAVGEFPDEDVPRHGFLDGQLCLTGAQDVGRRALPEGHLSPRHDAQCGEAFEPTVRGGRDEGDPGVRSDAQGGQRLNQRCHGAGKRAAA